MATKAKTKARVAPLEVLNLAVPEQRKRFREIAENTHDTEDTQLLADSYRNGANLGTYLKNGTQSPVRVGETQLFYRDGDGWGTGENYYVARPDGLIYSDSGDWEDVNTEQVRKYNRETPTAVVIPAEKRVGASKKSKLMALLNGDEDYNEATQDLDGSDYPSVSFECVNRFFELKSNRANSAMTQLGRLFADGTLAVVDYDPDVRMSLSKADKAQLAKHNRNPEKNKQPRPPEAGYTLVGGEWHRSATVIIRDTRPNGKTMLIGQDEGTYFGVELPQHAKSVKEAFEVLTPAEARAAGSVKRQGEWFLVPVEQKDVPALDQCIATTEDTLALSIDTPTSNKHWVNSNDIRIAKDGTVYAESPTLRHSGGEHKDVPASGWIKFLKNTALRSFSVAGVD